LVERYVSTLINEDYYYYYYIRDVLSNWQGELDRKRQTRTSDIDKSRVEEDRKKEEQRQKDSENVGLRMRKCLAPVTEGEQVLARWSVDGWYYQGIIDGYLITSNAVVDADF